MSVFNSLAGTVGLPPDQLRMVSGFLLSIPIGFGFQMIKGRNIRINVGTAIGLLLTYMVYQEMILSVIIQTVIVYAMVKKLGKKCAFPVFIETMLFLSVHHLYRQIYDYGGWTLDVTTILMMNTCKWTSFAWCVVDGTKEDDKLTDDQKLRRIKIVPSFLEYFGYIFFYAGCIAGPAYDFYEYDEFMDQKGVYTKLPSQKSILLETLRLLKNAILLSVLMISSDKYFSIETFFTDEYFYSRNNRYAQQNFLVKTIWLNVVLTLYRTRFLTGWCFSEATLAACGFTFNGLDGKTQKPLFERIRSINLRVELTYNIQEKVKMWNISVQNWLSRYVYLRVHEPAQLKISVKKQNQAQMAAYMTSAFWHGFYPGYYVSFVQWGIASMNAKFCYKASLNSKVFEIFDTNKIAWFIRFYWINTVFNAIGGGLILLSLKRNLIFFNSIYWIPYITNLLMFIFFIFTQFGQRSKKIAAGKTEVELSEKPKKE